MKSDLEQVWRNDDLKSDFTQSHIAIAGATGFVGTWLASSLLEFSREIDCRVSLIARDVSSAKVHFSKYLSANLGIHPLSELHNLKKVTHIIHAATPSKPSSGGGNPDNLKEVATNITDTLLQFASKQEVPNFMHLSSGAIYGKKPNTYTTFSELAEKTNFPTDPYTEAKLVIERKVETAHVEKLINATNPRLYSFTGPGIVLDAHFAIGNFMLQGLKRERINLIGNPKTTRSYLHPIDMTTWLLKVLAKPSLEPTHIGSEIGYSMAEIAHLVGDEFGVAVDATGDSSALATYYVPETTRTRARLGVEETIGLPEAICRWRNWLELQPGRR